MWGRAQGKTFDVMHHAPFFRLRPPFLPFFSSTTNATLIHVTNLQMALVAKRIHLLPLASGSVHVLPLEPGLTHWSGCKGGASPRSTWTAFPGFSRSPHLSNKRHYSSQGSVRPHRLHCNTQPFMAARPILASPQISLHVFQRSYSEMPGSSSDFTTRVDPASPDTSSENSNKSTSFISSSSWLVGFLYLLASTLRGSIGWSYGQEDDARKLAAQIPDAEIFAERAKLRKEKKELEGHPYGK